MQYLARLILYDSSLLLLLASNVFKLDLLSMRPTSSPSPLQIGQTNCQRVQRQRLFHQRTIFAGASIVIFNQASRHVHSLTTQALLPLPAAQAPVPSQLAHSFRRVVSLTGRKKSGSGHFRSVWVSNNLAFSVAFFAGPVQPAVDML